MHTIFNKKSEGNRTLWRFGRWDYIKMSLKDETENVDVDWIRLSEDVD
jgi:hypothetical protein